MQSRLMMLALGFMVAAADADTASGQSRRFGEFQSRSSVNSRHEKIKTEADEAYRRGDYAKTVELTSSVIDENSRDDVAYYLRGSAQVEIGRGRNDAKLIRQGIADARQAISIDDDDNPSYFLPYLYGMTNLAAVEDRPEHAKVAADVAGQVLRKSGLKPEDRANIRYQRALTYVYLRQFDDAVADFDEAIKLQSQHLGAYVGRAEAHVKAGNAERARESFDQAVDAFPSNALVFNNRGMFLQQQGELDQAIVDFTRALEIDPKYFYAHTNRGYTLMQQGELQAAESDFDESLRLNPQQPPVLSMRAAVRQDRGNLEGALDDYRKLLSLQPDNAVAHADYGLAQFHAGRHREALRSFERALKLKPDLRYLASWQYAALMATDQQEAAAKLADDVLAQIPERKKDWFDHVLEYVSGRTGEDELLAAVHPSNTQTKNAQLCEAHFFIGWRLGRDGEVQQADEHYEQALATGAKHLAAYRGARFARQKGAAAVGTTE